ncbi:MAG: hypothetical protein CO133_01455, partial [Candidatus Komeilibacteria bacterium CG_4_9_14_3_um_filter_37_5]
MKRLLSFVIIVLTMMFSFAQTSSSVGVNLNVNSPVFLDPTIIRTQGLSNFTLIIIDIESQANNVTVNGLELSIATEWPCNGKPTLRNISIYDGSTLVASIDSLIDDDYLFAINLPLAYGQTKTLTIKADISGYGTIQPRIGKTITNQEVINGGPEGSCLNLVNPELTEVTMGKSPELLVDTMFVFPGQWWYVSHHVYTKFSNFLPRVIQAIECNFGASVDLIEQDHFDWCIPYAAEFPSGYIYSDTVSNNTNFKWYSNSDGITGYASYWWWGNNNMRTGNIIYFWLTDNVALYSPLFLQGPRWQNLSSSVIVKGINGIRGDVSGDGIVNYDDMELMARGRQSYLDLYNNQQIDFGRGLILFDQSGYLIDAWLLNRWLVNHNDPLVANLGIGVLMSERIIQPQVPFTSSMAGDILTINTTGRAVMVSTILPNGQTWTKDTWVNNNGTISITVPDPSLSYRIQSVRLDGITDINEDQDKPT